MSSLQKYISIMLIAVAVILLSVSLPGPAAAADPGDVIAKVVRDNLHTEEWISSGAEPVPGGRFKFYDIIGDLNSGWASISVDEPVDGATMQAVMNWHNRDKTNYEVGYTVTGVTSMPGYELYEYTASDMAGVWFVMADYLIEVEIYETGNDSAVDLQTAKNLAQQVMAGLQQKAPADTPALVEQEKPASEGEKAPAAAAPVTGKPLAEPVEVANTDNIAWVDNGPTAPTIFTINSPHLVTYIRNYHWNHAKGSTPGTIGLKDQNGKVYGPWQAGGTPGQGGVPNANWEVFPNIVIPAGTYTVIDSEPSTWAQNKESGGRGMGVVKATPHFEVDGVAAKGSTKNGTGSRPGSGTWVESPAGVGSVGNIPGPSSTTEALVGVAVPGLLATLLGAMAGLGGGGGGMAPPTVTPLSPTGGGPVPGAGGTHPGAAGTRSNASAQEVGQLGRRRRGSQPAAAPTGPGRPAPEADNLMTNKGLPTQQEAKGEPEIYIDTVEMLEGPGSITTGVSGAPADKGIFIETAEESAVFRKPDAGVIIETAEEGAVLRKPDAGAFIDPAAEAAVLKQDEQMLQMDISQSGNADDVVLLDTSAFDEPVLEQDGGPLQEAETPQYDESGFDAAGYDRDGFDKDGFNKEGFDREGFNREGFDKQGFNKEGFDKEGFDKEGFNKEGFDKNGLDKEGFDKEGFNQEGFNREGFDKQGFDRDGFDREGFDQEGFDRDGFDRSGFDKNGLDKDAFNKEGFDKEGFNKEGFDQNGFDKEGFNREGFDRAGFDREGYDKNGFDKEGFNRKGFNEAGFDKEGFNQEGFDKQGFNKEGFDKEGFNKEGFDREGFDKEGFNKNGFDKEGFDRDGFDSKGFDKEGFNREGFNKEGFDREGYGKNGFDREGYNRDGYDVNGYDRKGYNRSGYDAKGYDRQGYDKSGFNKEGWDRDGYNRDGFNREGYDKEGFNREGYDRDGFDRQGRQREGYDQDGYDKNGFNRDGYDRDGYDRQGFDYEGYNRSGYDPWGYDRHGYGKDGYHWSGYNADGYNRDGRHWSENPFEGADNPFNVATVDPFGEGEVIPFGAKWTPTKPKLGEPYPKTVEKYGPKPWTDEIPQTEPEKPAVPSAEDTGVIGPEDPMNTLENHELDKNAQAAPEGQDGTGMPVPEEDIPPQQGATGNSDTFTYTDPDTGETSTYEYEKGYAGPRHGDRQILTGNSDGQTYELEFDAVKGKWINTESGNEFNPDDFDRWQNDLAEDKGRTAIDLEKMAKREDANSKAIDKNLEDWKRLEQMQKVADKYDIGEPGGPGDVDKAIEDLKKDMLAGKELDQEKMDKIRRVIDNRILGKTAADTGERWEEDWFINLGWALEANAATAKEVVTGEKADGSISWLGMAARVMITAATGGGASVTTLAGEITRQGAMDGILTVAEAWYRIKDSIDQGESDFRAVSKAIGLVVLGEEMGWLAGEGMGALSNEMLERFPAFTNKAADYIESALLKVSAKNQMYSKALGMISKESAEESLDQINKRLVDIGSDKAAKEIVESARMDYGLKSVADSFDDVTKGAGKTVGDSTGDMAGRVSKSATEGWTDVGESGGRAATSSTDDIARGGGKVATSSSDDIAEGGVRKAASQADADGVPGTGKAASQADANGVQVPRKAGDDISDASAKSAAGGDVPGEPPGRPPRGSNVQGEPERVPLNRGARAPEEVLGDPSALNQAERTMRQNVENFDQLPAAKQQELIRDQAIYDEYRLQAEERAWNLAQKVQRGEPLTVEDIMEMKSDPASMRTLKNIEKMDGLGSQLTPQESQAIQREFNRVMDENIHRPSYRAVEEHLHGRYPGTDPEGIRARTIRTPGTEPTDFNINTDNDVIAERLVTRPDGTTEWVEIPKSEWEDVYYEAFARNSGFSVDEATQRFPNRDWANMDDAARYREWANLHEEAPMDVYDPMGARDFSNQRTAILNGERPDGPLFDRDGNLLRDPVDAEQLGMMEKNKANDYWNRGDDPAEIMRNQTESLEQLRKTANVARNLEGGTHNMPPNMQEAIRVINNNNLSPSLRAARLRELGYNTPEDLAEKLTSRIGSFRHR